MRIVSQLEGTDERGVIVTRRSVVAFMLALIGYTPDQPLHQRAMLEPLFGRVDFLLPILERLLRSRANALNAGESVGRLS